MIFRGVLHDQTGDNTQSERLGTFNDSDEGSKITKARVDSAVVDDVISAVAIGRRKKRKNPDRLRAQIADIREPVGRAD